MRLRFALIALPVILAASPVGAMKEEKFKEEIAAARSSNPHQEIARLERLNAKGKLKKDQKIQVLYRIAFLYGTTAHDKPAAIKLYDEVLTLNPDKELAAKAKDNRDYANTQLGHIRSRLDRNQIDAGDLIANGQWEDVVRLVRESGLYVSEIVARDLYYAGYFCEPGMHGIGSDNTEKKLVGPCPQRRDPLNIDPLRRL